MEESLRLDAEAAELKSVPLRSAPEHVSNHRDGEQATYLAMVDM